MTGDKRGSGEHSPQLPTKNVTNMSPDSAARKAGMLLLLTAAASAVSVVARVSANADYPTLAESLAAISESRGLYGLGGAARLVSGLTLIGGAWFLSRTWIIRERLGTPLVPVLFGASGALTVVSGALRRGAGGIRPIRNRTRLARLHKRFDRRHLQLAMDNRQNRFHGGRTGIDRRGSLSMESRRQSKAHIARIGPDRRGDAVHLDRRRDQGAPDQRSLLLPLARRHRRHASDRARGKAFRHYARLIIKPRRPGYRLA